MAYIPGATGGYRYTNTEEALQTLLERFRGNKGVGRLLVMLDIRDFLAHCTLPDVINAVMSLSDQRDLNVLLGAGLRGQLYYAVILRKAQLEGLAS